MGLFGKSFGQSKDFLTKNDLAEALKTVEAQQKGLEMEWALVYDKMRTLMGRISKRAAIMEASQPPDEVEPSETVDGAPIVPTEPLLGLTKRQQAINDAILRSRRGVRP